MNKVELLAPAGNMEKLEIAYAYGADAVYIGGKDFSLRAAAQNFSFEEMKEAAQYAHSLGKKVYVTVNIIPRNEDMEKIKTAFKNIKRANADALIIADPGLIRLAKEYAPGVDIHISTQANIMNVESARMFYELGAKRLILARELSLKEIKEMRQALPDDVELEAFVHGAMCISYSGRCLLSNYMADRPSNRGQCAQPCRWKYHLMEEKRPGEYYPVYEDERGTYIFNSKDLCMIEHIPELIEAGITSFKIEGRMKSIFYVANVIRGYRKAINAYYKNPEDYEFDQEWMQDVSRASHRAFTKAFYFDEKPSAQNYETSGYIRNYTFAGKVLDYNKETKVARIMQRNGIFDGDEIEFITPEGGHFKQTATDMIDCKHQRITSTPHAQMVYFMETKEPVTPNSILMKKKGE